MSAAATLAHQIMTDSTHDSPLPSLDVPLGPEEIVDRLGRASRRGRLPGFRARPAGHLFLTDAWGTPFDSDLFATESPMNEGVGLGFTVRLRRKMPAIYAVILAATIWPGAPLTDRLMRLWFDWYQSLTQVEFFRFGRFEWFTYVWYVPLLVVPLPWMWRSWMRRSRASAYVSALEMIGKIAGELGVEPPPEAAAVLANQSTPKGS